MKNNIIEKYNKEFELCSDFSTPESWNDIIDRLIGILVIYRKRKGLSPLQIITIKDKYARLRFYTIEFDEYEDKWIQAADKACSKICERCGNNQGVNVVKINNWLYNLCKLCINEVESNKIHL